MKIIPQKAIRNLNISPKLCVEWVKESFCMKDNVQLPAKISLHPQDIDFFNTMPCLIPEYKLFSLKEVHRIKEASPALGSDIWLYNSQTGELLAMMDCDWITAMRTGAVATLAAQTFRKSGDVSYGIMGLGNTGRATILCLLDSEPDTMHHIQLLKYKNQAELFMERMKDYRNVEFTVTDNPVDLIASSDVVFSCVTEAKEVFCEDIGKFRNGCLVIPVHTRGFQNCDTVFEKVFADDTAHVCNFRYFNQFKKYAEISDVLCKRTEGRENDDERILSYNIGLGLHDAVFAWKIFQQLGESSNEIILQKETEKFWI